MEVNSPFVNCKVQEHLGDHDSVKHDIEDDANEDRPISIKSVRASPTKMKVGYSREASW